MAESRAAGIQHHGKEIQQLASAPADLVQFQRNLTYSIERDVLSVLHATIAEAMQRIPAAVVNEMNAISGERPHQKIEDAVAKIEGKDAAVKSTIFHAKYQPTIERPHALFGLIVKHAKKPCYEDGKWLWRSPDFCNQAKEDHHDVDWVATFNKKGKPVWVCMDCKSIYPR